MRARDLLLVLMLLPACRAPQATPADQAAGKDPVALGILREANAAAAAVRGVSYEYEYLGLGLWPGRMTGSVRMRRVTDQSDSWIRTDGTILSPPAGYEGAARRYETSIDGGTAYFIDHDRRTFESAPYEKGGNHLSRNQVYEALYQFVNPSPFAFEIEESSFIEYLGKGEVHGVACDLVKVAFPPGTGVDEAVWHFGRDDRLPRAVMMTFAQGSRPALFQFRIRNLRPGPAPAASDFVLRPPEGYAVLGTGERSLEVGSMTPEWSLTTATGETVSPATLRGKVTVLDFWVSHCPFCKATMPEIQKLHREYRGKPVRFLGVNVWESGDPIEFMRSAGFDYDTLLHGETLADLYGFQWQPALVVLGPDGTILHLEGGATSDRSGTIRRIIDAALAAM